MSDGRQDILDALRAAPSVLEGIAQGCTDEEARSARGGDENWSVVEIVCHLRDAEQRVLERLHAMRDEDNPFLAAYDQEQWARERNYAAANLREALTDFLRLRAEHIDELAALSAEQWERTGQHEEQGRITIASQALHIVAHDFMHAAQITRQLGGA